MGYFMQKGHNFSSRFNQIYLNICISNIIGEKIFFVIILREFKKIYICLYNKNYTYYKIC